MSTIKNDDDDDDDEDEAHLDEREEDVGSERNVPSHVGVPGTRLWSHRLVDWSLVLIHLNIVVGFPCSSSFAKIMLQTSTNAPSACW